MQTLSCMLPAVHWGTMGDLQRRCSGLKMRQPQVFLFLTFDIYWIIILLIPSNPTCTLCKVSAYYTLLHQYFWRNNEETLVYQLLKTGMGHGCNTLFLLQLRMFLLQSGCWFGCQSQDLAVSEKGRVQLSNCDNWKARLNPVPLLTAVGFYQLVAGLALDSILIYVWFLSLSICPYGLSTARTNQTDILSVTFSLHLSLVLNNFQLVMCCRTILAIHSWWAVCTHI